VVQPALGEVLVTGAPSSIRWNPPISRRQFLVATMGGAASLALASCGGISTAGAARSVNLTDGAGGFPSPFAANGSFGYTQMSYVYDALLWTDGSGALLPWLAESFTASADHLTYTFVLRDNLRWSDGRPLTVDDVVFTFDYFAEQGSFSPAVVVQPPDDVAGVKATGARTVEITLTGPDVTFPARVAGAIPIVPKHVWSSIGDPGSAQDVKLLVGSGPYRVASYTTDAEPVLFVARNDYFLGAPFVQRIEDRAIDDIFGALKSGSADIAYGVGLRPDTLAPFQNNPAFGMISDSGAYCNAFYWNLGREGALSDARFRRAMVMAVDSQDLVTRIVAGRGSPGNPGFLARSNPYYAPVPPISFDVAGANALLDGAGYHSAGGATRRASNGTPLSFELLIDSAQAPLAELLVGYMKRVGIELRPKEVTIGPQLFGNKQTTQYEIAVLPFPGPGPGGPESDPDILRIFFSSKVPPTLQGATHYANPTFDALADKQRVTFDVGQRKAIVAQMQTILAQDLPVVPLYFAETDGPYRKRVLGDQWYFTPGTFPTWENNKQLMVTGRKTGTRIRPV
jgi:peptide/nickel transport system substrate-binding protein